MLRRVTKLFFSKRSKTISNRKMSKKVLEIHILQQNYENIKAGKCTSVHIRESGLPISSLTCGIHLFANSRQLLWDSLKYFKHKRGKITLNTDSIECKYLIFYCDYFSSAWRLFIRCFFFGAIVTWKSYKHECVQVTLVPKKTPSWKTPNDRKVIDWK